MYYKKRPRDTDMREIMNLNKCIPIYLYQAAGAGRHGAVSKERREAGETPSVDHPELSNHLPAALPHSIRIDGNM